MLEEYLYIDRTRIRSYAEQIGAAVVTNKRPQWKVGLSLTGPLVEGQQTATPRPATDHEMITAIIEYLKKEELLFRDRPKSDDEAESTRMGFVLETMQARKIIFRCDPKAAPSGLREIVVWVSNPEEKPSAIIGRAEDEGDLYEPQGMFVYLIEGYWENEDFQHAFSMFTALNVLLSHLKSIGAQADDDSPFTSRDDHASPTAILERAGGVKGELRRIRSLYRIRSVSQNKIVNVGGTTVRCYDLFGYPVFIATAATVPK